MLAYSILSVIGVPLYILHTLSSLEYTTTNVCTEIKMLHHRLEVSEVWMKSLLVKFESRLTHIESILQKLPFPTKLDGLKWHHCKSTNRAYLPPNRDGSNSK